MRKIISVFIGGLLALALAGCNESASAGSAAAGSDSGSAHEYVKLDAGGPVSGEIDHRINRAAVAGDIVGIACIGFPTINITLAEKDRPFGVKLQLRLPMGSGAGSYAVTATGLNDSARATLQLAGGGGNKVVLIKDGKLNVKSLDRGYAGDFHIGGALVGQDGQQTLTGEFRITQATGKCP